MRSFFIIALGLLFFMFFGCENNNSTNNRFVKEFKEVITLKSTSIPQIEQFTPGRIHLLDSLLVIRDYTDDEKFHIYNKNTLKKITAFGLIGDGPDEFKEPEWNGQSFKKPNSEDTFIRIIEYGYGIIYDVNLSKVLRKEPDIKDQKYYFNPDIYNCDNVFFLGEEGVSVLGEATYNESIKYFKTSLNNMGAYVQTGEFNQDKLLKQATLDDRINLDRSYLSYSERNNKFIAGYLRYNKIVILNSNLEEINTVIYGDELIGPKSTNVWAEDNIFYFRNSYCGEIFFYISYIGPDDHGNAQDLSNEIHVYDFKGNPLKKYLLDVEIEKFVIDEKDGKIYIITGNDDNPYVIANI